MDVIEAVEKIGIWTVDGIKYCVPITFPRIGDRVMDMQATVFVFGNKLKC